MMDLGEVFTCQVTEYSASGGQEVIELIFLVIGK